MGLFRSVALAAAVLSAQTARGAHGECGGGACEADEAGLLQSSVGPKKQRPGDGLVPYDRDDGDKAESEEAFKSMPSERKVSANTVLEFDPADIEDALVVGTEANIGANDAAFSSSVMDLTGIWYVRWDPSDGYAVQGYRSSRMEIAFTFADSLIANYSDPGKPFTMKVPGMSPKHWAYSNSLAAKAQMFTHSITWDWCHNWTFAMEDNQHGFVEGLGPFNYLNEHQWERPTETVAGDFTYKLSRIVKADGSKTEHYDDYLKLMEGYLLRVWGNEDQEARCEATAPLSLVCSAFSDLGNCEA